MTAACCLVYQHYFTFWQSLGWRWWGAVRVLSQVACISMNCDKWISTVRVWRRLKLFASSQISFPKEVFKIRQNSMYSCIIVGLRSAENISGSLLVFYMNILVLFADWILLNVSALIKRQNKWKKIEHILVLESAGFLEHFLYLNPFADTEDNTR
jgi:hypothetical protein